VAAVAPNIPYVDTPIIDVPAPAHETVELQSAASANCTKAFAEIRTDGYIDVSEEHFLLFFVNDRRPAYDYDYREFFIGSSHVEICLYTKDPFLSRVFTEAFDIGKPLNIHYDSGDGVYLIDDVFVNGFSHGEAGLNEFEGTADMAMRIEDGMATRIA
jgi:hypothetical protein